MKSPSVTILSQSECVLSITDLLSYLSDNLTSLPNYGNRYDEGEPISKGWNLRSNEIIAKRMTKSRQMRWNRRTDRPF